VADFIRLYIVLIFIPIAAISVPAIMTWARDLDATARRTRQIDEQSKIVNFWDNWVKAVVANMPAEERWNTGNEALIRDLIRASREELAGAGRSVISICHREEYREVQKFRLYFSEFKVFRAGLPWYRRALLLYNAPNANARLLHFLFFFFLAASVVGEPLLALIGQIHPVHHPLTSTPWLLQGVEAFASVHPVLARIFNFAYLLFSALFMRRGARKCENDQSLFVWDRISERMRSPDEDFPSKVGDRAPETAASLRGNGGPDAPDPDSRT
jgi:hypothetical protein